MKNNVRKNARKLIHSVRRRVATQVLRRTLYKPVFHVDSPTKYRMNDREVVISGWYLSGNGSEVKGVRVVNNKKVTQLKYGTKRVDVLSQFPKIDKERALNSGFYKKIPFQDGLLTIEVDCGDGYEEIHRIELSYSRELYFDMVRNSELANRYAEHQNLLANRRQYYCEPANEHAFQRHKSDPRLVALYLPQFHPIPENDFVWGKGFTEWQNVTSASPRFVGHQQPLLPSDLGFYDLRLESVMEEQISLAKHYGIYGFSFYYYWFSGKKVLEKPIESFLKHKEWDFNFSICWANENWTKRWDGRDKEVIVAQKYSKEDPLNFIKDVENILLDPRYICEDGKPVLTVYRPASLKDPARYTKVWRDYFKKKHGRDLHLVSVLGFDYEDPRNYGFDVAMDFAPLTTLFKKTTFPNGEMPFVNVDDRLIDINYKGMVIDYRKVSLNADRLYPFFDFPTYKSVMPSWDNDARRKGKRSMVFDGANPELYTSWLDQVLKLETVNRTNPLIYINAWNEWAEGTMMEPSQHLGHATLKRTAEVLAKYSKNMANMKNYPAYGVQTRDKDTRLAVVAHVYYEDEWKYIENKLKNIGKQKYDLFITITMKDEKLAKSIARKHPRVRIVTVPNRGRDVLPFIFVARRLSEMGYEWILKLQTKKSLHREDGNKWFEQVIDALLPSSGVGGIVKTLDESPGIIGPEGHYVSMDKYIGGNEEKVRKLLVDIYDTNKADEIIANRGELGFMAGTMFWVSISAIQPILDLYLGPDDFESERGQIDGTTAHAIERLLTVIPSINHSNIYQVSLRGKVKNVGQPLLDYPFAP